MLKYILFLVFTFFLSIVNAQNIVQLNTEPTGFLEDLEKLLITLEGKKEGRKSYAQFETVFNSTYQSDQKTKIITNANELLKKRIKQLPDFTNYIASVTAFGQSKLLSNEEFNTWSGINKDLLNQRSPKKFNKFISFSKDFFSAGIIYQSASVKWIMNKGDFSFSFDKVPYVNITNLDLLCKAKNDSSIIYSTKGIFNTSTLQWVGKGGTLTWERVKLPADKTYAELSDYKMSLRGPGFSADSVRYYTTYFNEPIIGKLREKVVTLKDYKKAKYPSFASYKQSLKIENIFNNIDYEGGFRIDGLYITGGGDGKTRGSLTVKNKGKAFIIAEAKNILISDDGIKAPNSRATVFIYGGEIISHSAVTYQFTKKSKEHSLINSGQTNIRSPFESTFHQMDMHFENLSWKEGDNKLNFGALKGNTDKKARFESKDYFSIDNYNRFQGNKSNVLYRLYKMYENNNEENEIDLLDFASYVNSTLPQIEAQINLMNNIGVIYYDKAGKKLFVKDRLKKYIEARSGKGDYDDLQIESEVKKGANGYVNLVNNDLIIDGIRGFTVARIKNVKFFPKGGQVVVKKDRNINFSGVINAGRAEFFGENLDFIYEDFKVNLPLVDSLRFRVLPINNRVKQKQVRLLSSIEQLQGTLYLDDPDNRSGRDTNLADFPKVSITNPTYVYYDKGTVAGRKYDRNDFKFKVNPFEKDSLNYFTTRGLRLKGKLYSAGIFPTMDGDLTVQEDYALGFITENVTDKIYGGRADYSNLLMLNSKGLQGKGDLKYLTSSATSDDIVFFPDSLVAVADNYENKEQSAGPNVPNLKAKDVLVTYQPKRGIWTTESQDSLINVFEDGITKLKGKIKLTQAGMTGEGNLSFNQIEVLSYSFKLQERTIDADTCEFIVKGGDPLDPLSFQAINMNMHIDFDSRIGDFESNDGNSFLEFPDNQFICYMDKFQWFMDDDKMGMENDEDSTGFNIETDLEILEPNFFSTHPKQDSLSFASNSARYDLQKKELTCLNIKYIPIADAKIYPDSGILVVGKKAAYKPLTNSKILANSVTKYHTFNKADIQLYSKKKYVASGIYMASPDTSLFSDIVFSKIAPNNEQITMGEGEVGEDKDFSISPQFKFYGKAYINASEMGVTYKGKTSIVHDCKNLASGWIDFDAKVDTSNILIPLGKDFEKFTSGLMIYQGDSIGYYSSFLAPKQYEKDHAITPANGWLAYNKQNKEFQIGNKDKIKERSMPGNFVSLNTEDCSLFADGLIDFANNLGQLELEPIGTLSYDTLSKTKLKISSSISFNFPFNDDALEAMGNNLAKIQSEEPLDLTATTYDMIVKNKLKTKKADKAISDLNLYGKLDKFPKQLISNLTILDLDIKWNEEKKSFLAKGNCGIANVGETQVFKKSKVYFLLEKKRSGDVMHLYIEPFKGMFYYFNYKRGIFQTISSNPTYNSIITDIKPKKATFKGKGDAGSFQYMACSKSKPLLFLRNFEEELAESEEEEIEGEDPFGEAVKENSPEKDKTNNKKSEEEEEEEIEEEEEEEDDW